MSARAWMFPRTARWALAGAAACILSAATSSPVLAQGGAPAAATAPADASSDAGKLAKGKDLFANYGCGSCHSLQDAGATGHVGPSLDGNSNLTHAFVVDRVSNGQGPMPAFAGQMTPQEIDALATYVVHAAAK